MSANALFPSRPPELSLLDAFAQAELVRRREVSAVELVEAAIARIEALNPALNAVVATTYDEALERAAGPLHGPFAGVPFLLKDLAAERAGTVLTDGSRLLAGQVSTSSSEVVARFERAGLVVLGRTSSPEFGMLPTCEPLLYGPTRNPWSPDHSTSGSSGGSAAAVASGMVPMAHGNDAGGSLRYPASACGLFALKPTRGRVPVGPRYDGALGAWIADHALTRTVRDSALLLDLLAGPGAPSPARRPRLVGEVGAEPGRLRIAWSSRTPSGEDGHPDVLAALDTAVTLLESLGHELVEAGLPRLTAAVGRSIGTLFEAAVAGIVGFWVRRLGRPPRPGELEPFTEALWQSGHRVSAEAHLQAVQQVQAYARAVGGFLSGYDGHLTPTLSAPPAPVGWITSTPADPLRAGRRGGRTTGYAAVVANLVGNPAMSVPMTWTADGLPVGVHVLGRFGDEATLVRLAAQVEAARPWTGRLPTIHASRPRWTGGGLGG